MGAMISLQLQTLALSGLALVGLSMCGGSHVPSSIPASMPGRRAPAAEGIGPVRSEVVVRDLGDVTGSLNEYLAFALANSPETRASFEQWRAARFRISPAGRLPEPTVAFGYFLRTVETRVGPQRYKLGISQAFPWPTKLSAGEDAATERAKAAARMVDANVLSVRKSVAEVYWTLWLIDEEHRLKTEHDAVLESLAGAVRGRLQIGAASLADLNLVDLNIARHHDHKGRHEQAARKASSKLRAMLGAQAGNEVLSISDFPKSGLPAASESALGELAALHPMIERFTHLATSEEHVARAQRADRFPRLKIGLDIIGTGDAAMAGVEDSGKDAVVLSAALSIPLWGGSYSDATAAAYANRNAHEAMREAGKRRLEAMLGIALANVRDAQRRIELYEKTLVPQAETTFQAVLGGYQTGRSTVAAVILAQRDLIDLQIEYAGARADHAKFWAELEFAAGTQLVTKG